MQFTELSLCNTLQEGLEAMNFTEMTPVQELAIPVILEKKDVIACAQTGTGKTAAFLLPLLNNLQSEPHEENKVNAIIMAPTRELAQQIDQQMEGFSYFTPFSSVAVYGGNDGEAWDVQKRGLLSGADVVIATPGRLLSHINLYNIDFSGVKYFILDEADRMLDMGFFDDIMKIANLLPKERQTVMFSATMPPKIQQLAKTILRDPEEITIAISRPPETILQSAYICYDAQKMGILKQLFKDKKPNKVILFSGSKQKVKDIARTLHKMGLSAGEMHSDLDQMQRNHVMHEFKNERVDILVATDIVARGIDIDDITLVINYDVPYDAEDYVHRIGRTARAGDTGMAITFVSPGEQYRFSLIEKFLQKEIYRIPVPADLGEAPEYNPTRESAQRGRGSRTKTSKGGKRSGESDKSQGAGGTERPPKSERKGRKERPAKLEKQEETTAEQIEGAVLHANERGKSGNRRKKGSRVREEDTLQLESREAVPMADNHPEGRDKQQKNRDDSVSRKGRGKGKSRRKQEAASDAREPLGEREARKQGTSERVPGEKTGKRLIKKSERLQQDAVKQASDGVTTPQESASRAHGNNSSVKGDHSRVKGDKRTGEELKREKRSGKTGMIRPEKNSVAQSAKAGESQNKPVEPGRKKRWSWWPFGKK